MSGLITVIRGGSKGAPKKAPTFFSRVDQAAQELPRTKGTGKEFMAELKKQPGVKKAELDDRKLSEIESAPKMTKQEFLKKLQEKPAPKVEESIKSHPTDVDLDEKAMKLIDEKADEMTEERLGKRDRFNRYEWDDYQEGAVKYLKDYEYDRYLREAKRDLEENRGEDFPKFDRNDLRLPGGENYREILLKLPSNRPSIKNMFRADYNAAVEAADRAGIQNYQSSHWDEPNVLAHIRVQDRTGPNGEKILHVEEIQSDWHQAGRKKGYATSDIDSRLKESEKELEQIGLKIRGINNRMASLSDSELDEFNRLADERQKLYDKQGFLIDEGNALLDKRSSGVPDAPFKKNWHELATKRIMDYAIENGYDKVAITPGIEHVKRYEDAVRKVVDEIAYNPNTGYFTAIKNGEVVQNQKMDPEMLEKTVGGETARNLLASEPNNIGIVSMKSKDMTIGGELYKNLYDRDVVNFINKEYGPHGASVGKMPIETGSEMSRGPQGTDMIPTYQPTYSELHSIDITPQMRETIQNKGQPLYQATGIGLTGAAAAPKDEVQFSDNPDTMMMELQDKGFAGGGLLKKAAKAIKGTQEVLPAAEREANKAKFLEPSVVKERMYHATNADIEKFRPSHRGAYFVTPDRDFANQHIGYDSFGGATDDYLEGANVMPVYVNAKNPFDYENLQDLKNLFRRTKKEGVNLDREWKQMIIDGDWSAIENKKVQRAIKNLGHDSFYVTERLEDGEPIKNLGVFSPEQIKSAIGNRGTYDVTDPDINKAQGGLARAKRK